MNIRQLSKHRGELIAYLSSLSLKFDVIILSEIGDDAIHYLSTLLDDYAFFYQIPHNNHYGGIAIYVKEDRFQTAEREDLQIRKTCKCSKCNFESVFVKLRSSSQTYIVGGVYRHPGGDVSHFSQALEKSLNMLDKEETCILAGDYNINLLNTSGCITTEYLTTLLSQGFLPYITRPTRITEYTATLIDHFFVKIPTKSLEMPIHHGILFNDKTDHLPIFLIMRSRNKSVSRKQEFGRIYNNTNIQKFVHLLAPIKWEEILNIDDVDAQYERFYNILGTSFNQAFPLVKISRARIKDKPWITAGLRKSKRKKTCCTVKVSPDQVR